MSILQYFYKKENRDKDLAFLIYGEVIKVVSLIISKNSELIKNDFKSSFEITSIILFCIFHGNNNNPLNIKIKNNNLNQELMHLFINDLDHSLKMSGIGDMSIGKYVKSYVKKFYFRINKMEAIFNSKEHTKFRLYLEELSIFKKLNNNQIFIHEFFKNAEMLVKKSKKNQISIDILSHFFN